MVRKKKSKKAEPMLDVELRTSHSINGVQFSPGRVRVPKDIADLLAEQERRVTEEVEQFYAKDRAYIIGPGNRAHRVSPEVFETAHSAYPIGTASLRGYSPSGG